MKMRPSLTPTRRQQEVGSQFEVPRHSDEPGIARDIEAADILVLGSRMRSACRRCGRWCGRAFSRRPADRRHPRCGGRQLPVATAAARAGGSSGAGAAAMAAPGERAGEDQAIATPHRSVPVGSATRCPGSIRHLTALPSRHRPRPARHRRRSSWAAKDRPGAAAISACVYRDGGAVEQLLGGASTIRPRRMTATRLAMCHPPPDRG